MIQTLDNLSGSSMKQLRFISIFISSFEGPPLIAHLNKVGLSRPNMKMPHVWVHKIKYRMQIEFDPIYVERKYVIFNT
jgi:hypothetical protein